MNDLEIIYTAIQNSVDVDEKSQQLEEHKDRIHLGNFDPYIKEESLDSVKLTILGTNNIGNANAIVLHALVPDGTTDEYSENSWPYRIYTGGYCYWKSEEECLTLTGFTKAQLDDLFVGNIESDLLFDTTKETYEFSSRTIDNEYSTTLTWVKDNTSIKVMRYHNSRTGHLPTDGFSYYLWGAFSS